MPIHGQSKTTKKRTCRLLTKNSSYWEENLDRCWTREYPLSDCEYRRNWCIFFVMENMCIEKMMEQFNSGELKKIFRNISRVAPLGWMVSGRKAWQEEEEIRKDSSTVLFLQELLCISELFKDIQDAILLIVLCRTMWIFRATSSSTRRMCNQFTIYLHSGLILGGQNLNNRQTVFFLLVDPMDKNHKDPDTIDLSVPRHAQYMHKAWKRHQNAVFWVDINLAMKKGLKFYQTRSNAIILHETLPAYCIPKVVRMETGEVINEKVYMSPRPPPKISLKHDWKRELGSEHALRPEGQVVQQSRSFQSNQPIPDPSRDRTGQHGC